MDKNTKINFKSVNQAYEINTDEDAILSTEACIDGETLRVAFDIGATSSIIAHDVVVKYGIKIYLQKLKSIQQQMR